MLNHLLILLLRDLSTYFVYFRMERMPLQFLGLSHTSSLISPLLLLSGYFIQMLSNRLISEVLCYHRRYIINHRVKIAFAHFLTLNFFPPLFDLFSGFLLVFYPSLIQPYTIIYFVFRSTLV